MTEETTISQALMAPQKRGRPTGRPPGGKTHLPKAPRDVIQSVAEALEAKGVGLQWCAEQRPHWFFETFYRLLVPKDVQVTASKQVVFQMDMGGTVIDVPTNAALEEDKARARLEIAKIQAEQALAKQDEYLEGVFESISADEVAEKVLAEILDDDEDAPTSWESRNDPYQAPVDPRILGLNAMSEQEWAEIGASDPRLDGIVVQGKDSASRPTLGVRASDVYEDKNGDFKVRDAVLNNKRARAREAVKREAGQIYFDSDSKD